MHNKNRYNNVTNSPHLGTKGCLPYQVSSELRNSSQAVIQDHLASATTDHELQMVEFEIFSQAKRLRELKLQQKKKTLLLMNNKANEIELDMQAYCRNTIQPNYSCRPKMINGWIMPGVNIVILIISQ